MLNIKRLSFSIGGTSLFDEASVNIPTGHKVGIVGRNGTGKTSLFKLIRNEWALDSGAIEIPSHFRIGGVEQEAPATNDPWRVGPPLPSELSPCSSSHLAPARSSCSLFGALTF